MRSAPAIGFEYRASRWAPRLLLGATALAWLGIGCSGLPWWSKGLLALLVAAARVRALRRLRLPVNAAGWSAQGWSVRGVDGGDDAARLLASRVLAGSVLVYLHSARYGRVALWLMPDNSDADLRRRLRARLSLLADSRTAD